MTQVIDGKVVEMKFDNADFEKNVAQSMSTLDKLKQALNFDSVKSLDSVTKASKRVDLSSVGSAVETVQAKFSALQVIGVTALSELTKSAMRFGANVISSVVNPIKTGGMNRALNIEQAKFQLEGLHVAWDDIKDDIDYAVSGTAYGMDVAAKAASQLTASGVKTGDEMKAALRGISGVAAMTSSSYEEISPIFTTIAGQGKLMTMQLRQLEARGLNAASTLAEAFGTTEAEIREMVTDGKIDFEAFAWAMDNAFGEHAKDANKTFTGAMSNVRAALSRIGQGFAEPYMENMRKIAVAAIDVLNAVKTALAPIYKDVSGIMELVQTKITDLLGSNGLKDGISYIVTAVRNAFYALLIVLEPVKEAFYDIFPKQDIAEKFAKAAKSLKEFTDRLILSKENSEKLKDTFKGLFAFIDIIKMAFSGFFRALAPYTGTFGDMVSDFLGLTGGLGNSIVKLRDYIKENDTFANAFSKAAEVIFNAGSKIKEVFSGIVDALKKFKENHIDDKDFSGFTNFFERIKERIPTLSELGDILGTVFDKIKSVLSNFGPAFKAGVQLISDSIGILLRGFADAFSGSGNDPFTAFLNMFSTTTIGTMLVAFAQSLAQVKKQVQYMGGLSGVLFELRKSLITFQADLKADVLMKLAKAIAVLAASIFVLSLINPSRLASSMVAIGIMTKILEQFISFITTIPTPSITQQMQFYGISSMMTSLGIAILVLAGAVKVLSTIDFLDLVKGVGAVLILIKALSDQAVLLSNIDTKVMKGAKTMIALAIAVRILASAVKAMADLPLPNLIKGLGATIALMYSLAGVAKLMQGTKISVGTGVAFIALAAALLILTNAVEKLGSIPIEQLVQGLAAAAIGIFAMSLALTLIGSLASGGTLVAASIALIALSASLEIFTDVVKKLGEMQPEQLAQGLASAVIAILAMSLALTLLTTLSSAGELLAAAASLIILAEALNIISKAIERLGSMSVGDLIKGFVTLAAVVALFAVASVALTPILPVMAALAGIIALLGVGITALGIGVAALAFGLSTLATSCTVVIANLGAILTIIAALIPAIATALANGIIQFVVVIGNGAAQIVKAVVNLCHEILQGLSTLLPDIFQFVITLLIQFIDAIVVLVPYLVEAGMKLIIGLCDGISRQLPELVRAGNELLISFINSMADGIRRDTPRIIEATDNLMSAMIDAIVMWFTHFDEKGGEIVDKIIEGIKKTWETIKSVGKELVDLAGKGIEEGIANIIQLGKDLVSGFIQGIKDAPGKVWDAACSVANNALNAIANTQESNSPSRKGERLGGYLAEGYAIGITDGSEDVQHAAEEVTNEATDAFDKAQERTKEFRDQQKKEAGLVVSYWEETRKKLEKAKQTDTKINEEARQEHIKTKNALKEETEATEAQTKATEGLSKATGSATKSQKSFLESMKDTISNQIDIFSKMELKTEISAQQMLDNMKSNIDGVASWTAKLNSLVDRGISQELYKKLAEMGPKGYETLNAFVQMTDEQLQQANTMFAQSLTLGEEQAAIVDDGMTKAGQNGIAGLNNALLAGVETLKATGNQDGQAVVDGVNQGLGNASPSHKTYQSGVYVIEGLNNGMKGAYPYLKGTIEAIARNILGVFNNGLRPSLFYEIGKNAIQGLANGLADSDAVAQALKKADEICRSISEKMANALKEKSPSRVTMEIGRYATMGLAIGLEEAAGNVYRAASQVANGAAEGFEMSTGRIEDILNSELDFNPVITPILDLSVVRAQLASINDSFNAGSVGVPQNGGKFSANPDQPTSINFTQNNYSPKELSRYDIYRNTKNQISMMKGVIAHA